MRPTHAPADHPAVKPAKTGILIANLGTPDGYDYWSMRRYLNEFLSDRRVVDVNRLIWQPLLQAAVADPSAWIGFVVVVVVAAAASWAVFPRR